MQAERIEVDLSLLSALVGNIEFTETKIVRPRFVIDEPIKSLSQIGESLAKSDGRIGDVVREARAAVEANPGKPDMSAVSSQPFGRVRLEDAMVTFKRPINGAEEQISSISGVFDWPQTSGVASFRGTAIWHGEETEVDNSATRALLLLAGGTSPLQINLSSTPLTLSFNGSADISKDQFFEGTLSLTSPSLRRTLEWSRMATIPGAPIGSFTLDASVSGSANRMKLDGLTATLNDNPAKGVIEVVLDREHQALRGHLLSKHWIFIRCFPVSCPAWWHDRCGCRDRYGFPQSAEPGPACFSSEGIVGSGQSCQGGGNSSDPQRKGYFRYWRGIGLRRLGRGQLPACRRRRRNCSRRTPSQRHRCQQRFHRIAAWTGKPLRTRQGYRIHGTNDPNGVGFDGTSGCFRLTNTDVIDLFNRVALGAKVIVQ